VIGIRREADEIERPVDLREIDVALGGEEIECHRLDSWSFAGNPEVLLHREIREQFERLPRTGETATSPFVGKEWSHRRTVKLDAPSGVDKSGEGIDGGGFACAIGADQADDLALADSDADAVDRSEPAERHVDIAGIQHDWCVARVASDRSFAHRPFCSSGGDVARRTVDWVRLREPCFERLPVLLVGSSNSFGIEDRGQDQAQAGEQGVRATEFDVSVEHDEPDAERSERSRDDRARDARDATEIGKGEEGQPDEWGETVRRQLPAAVTDERTADSGEE
jgi:hypothetical protein